MKSEKRGMVLGMLSGITGAVFGALSGSQNMFIVGAVAAVIALLTSFAIKGIVK